MGLIPPAPSWRNVYTGCVTGGDVLIVTNRAVRFCVKFCFVQKCTAGKCISTKLTKKSFVTTKSETFGQKWDNNLNPSQMVEFFYYLLAQVLDRHTPLKECFIRDNKNSFQLADKWLTRKTKSLKTSREKFLNDENHKIIFELKQSKMYWNQK